MSNQIVHIIAYQEKSLERVMKQIKEVLGQHIKVKPTTLKEIRPEMVHPNDIVFLYHPMIKGIVNKLIPPECPCIVAKRDINMANCRELINLPPGQKILVVNDTKKTIEEAVASLRETISEHEYFPYNPDENIPDDIDYILTPGEIDLLPDGLTNVINIGDRILDIETFIEFAELLGIDYQPQMVKRYMKSLVSLSLEYEGMDYTKGNRMKDIRNVSRYTFDDVIAESTSMVKTVQLAKEFAKTSFPVFIYGEKGAGKSMLAQAIHHYSYHNGDPIFSVNCKSNPIDMLEKELFGFEEDLIHTMGAFEITNNGTVYLEDVDELPFSLQIRIFNAVKESNFLRVGGTTPIPLQARLIACSTKELDQLADNGTFYLPFYEMLTSQSLIVPSLKERREDFVPLIEELKRRLKKTDVIFTDEAMEHLLCYGWPRNVTELYDCITYICSMGEDTIGVKSLPINIRMMSGDCKLGILKGHKINPLEIIKKIEAHGFLEENIEILKIFALGKHERTSFGRLTLKKRLEEAGIYLSEQQIRMRMEILQELELLIVRQGRAGSTISQIGEEFLQFLQSSANVNIKGSYD
ncbi:sigma 54-interacting transcriptional regulator [Neobacillus bataviensis]|uniref:sigma 54-interacting transcriptional regulator n=1 Tax=Neobacillus bataviensis TaxID=220685 RepID=UPI001CC0FF18|nr:sigma 54-interacting transcriptional regulator [Neobacillus bataviensis]